MCVCVCVHADGGQMVCGLADPSLAKCEPGAPSSGLGSSSTLDKGRDLEQITILPCKCFSSFKAISGSGFQP